MIKSNGTGLRQMTNFSEPVTEIELSGDGTVAFVTTTANRIAQINVATAQSVDIVPPTPYICNENPNTNDYAAIVLPNRFLVSRGTVTPIPAVGAATDSQTATPPFPLSLDGVELQVNGVAVPIAGVSPASIGFPATWDLPDTPVDVEIWASSASASPLVPAFEIGFQDQSFIYDAQLERPNLLAVHQDFLSLISAASPAQPGEYVHVYATDLGPVIPAPPAGLPAPLEPLSLLALPMSCTLGADSNPSPARVSISFAGLAPGLLNIFQVDVQMPMSFQGSPSVLTCLVGYPSVGAQISGNLTVQ